MDDTPEPPAPDPRPRKPRRRLAGWLALGALLILAGSALAFAGLAAPDDAPSSGFRFEQTYVSVDKENSNSTKVTLTSWYTNGAQGRLKDVRIIAIAVDQGRNVAVGRAEQKLGDLKGRTSFESSFDMTLNATRAHRVDLLVMVEGLIVATGQGHLGFHGGWTDHESYLVRSAVQTGEATLKLQGEFAYDYRR